MTDGTLSVRRRDPKAAEAAEDEAKQAALASGSYEYFADMENIFGTGHIKAKKKDMAPVVGPADEFKVERRRKEKLKAFEKHLKAFKYSAALDEGLKKVIQSRALLHAQGLTTQDVRPSTTFALIQELIQRDGLQIALSGRDDVTLEPILSFLVRHVTDPRFGEMASDVAGVIIGKL
jgi:U3 small nucleolar RNA-associated protein 15